MEYIRPIKEYFEEIKLPLQPVRCSSCGYSAWSSNEKMFVIPVWDGSFFCKQCVPSGRIIKNSVQHQKEV